MFSKKPLVLFLIGSLLFLRFPSSLQAAVGEKAMVVTPDFRATQAALEVLKQGGNAVDAAVAAQWALNVVEPQASGIGGGGLFLFYDVGTRRILSFDGSIKAPEEASPKMFLDGSGKPFSYQPERNTGGLSVGVPGLLKLMEEVHAKYGTHKFPFAKLMEPAILLAEEGTEVSIDLARALRENVKRLALLDPERGIFFKDSVQLGEGQKLTQSELAKALRLIQGKGTEAFYEGAIAKAITSAVRKNSYRAGLLSRKDLEDYTIATRDPAHSTYQGYASCSEKRRRLLSRIVPVSQIRIFSMFLSKSFFRRHGRKTGQALSNSIRSSNRMV
ncbi:MAG: gamma-glutamyltransferase [Candidatus Omnitrophica bacterium]|nr:gamma-glutamyltransferase [Candidatus Omnitrophota bacterium]